MAHGEGEGRRSVLACSQHATPGRVKARGLVGVYAHLSEAVRTRGQGCPGAAYSRAEHAAARHSRENAGWGFAAAVKNAKCSAVVWLASLSRLSRNENGRASLPSLVWLVYNSRLWKFG